MKQTQIFAIILIAMASIAIVAVSGCTSPKTSATATPAPSVAPTAVPTAVPTTASSVGAVLTINGSVNNPMSLTMADLRAIGIKHVNLTLNAHGNISYVDADSISLNSLLSKAQLKSNATNVLFIGSDGYVATVTLANVTADNNSVIAFTTNTGLRDCLPTQKSMYWVQNLTAITVQ